MRSRHSRRAGPIYLSANEFATGTAPAVDGAETGNGAWTGVRWAARCVDGVLGVVQAQREVDCPASTAEAALPLRERARRAVGCIYSSTTAGSGMMASRLARRSGL